MDGCIVGPATLTPYDQAWGASHRKDDKKETTNMTLEVSLLEDLKNGHSKRCYNLLLYTKRGKATEKMS